MRPFARQPSECFENYMRRVCGIIVGEHPYVRNDWISRKKTLRRLTEAMDEVVHEAFRDGEKHGKLIGKRDVIEVLHQTLNGLDQ